MGRWTGRLAALGGALLLITALIFAQLLGAWQDGQIFFALLLGPTCLLPSVLSLLCLHMALKRPADSHTALTLIEQYRLEVLQKRWRAWKLYLAMAVASTNCREAQMKVIISIIKEQAETQYGKKVLFGNINSYEDFTKIQPLTSYADMREYIEKIAKGEQNVLTNRKTEYFSLTSGAAGKNNIFPVTDSPEMTSISQLFNGRCSMHRQFYGSVGLKRIFELRVFHQAKRCPCGIKMGRLASHIWKQSTYSLLPEAIMEVNKTDAAFYVQAIFALAEKEVALIVGFSSDMLLAFFKFIETHWDKLCSDIERGTIRRFPDLPEDIRAKLNKSLKKNPKRASELRKAFMTKVKGKARRLWPDLTAASVCRTGSFVHSAAILKETYMDGILMNFILHGGSEGFYGIMLESDANQTIYTLMPQLHFLEFIPVEGANDRVLTMDQLEVGKCYELVVTNREGLYRYKVGDIIKVVGFWGSTPKYTFEFRTGEILNVSYDRTPEAAVFEALTQTMNGCSGIQLVDYTACESFHVETATGANFGKGRYIIFVEIFNDDMMSTEQLNKFDRNLCTIHETYEDFRQQGNLEAAEIIQVRTGSFHGLRDFLMGDRPTDQVKMPRVLRNHQALKFLWNKKLQSLHF